MKRTSLFVLVLVYILLSASSLFLWERKGLNDVTGDEPHYLIMASGIANHASLEQRAPYRDEFRTREIYKGGLAPLNAEPSPVNTHAVMGPNGLYNVHNIGLPLLLSIPFLLGGVIGAKIFMILCGAVVLVCAWRFALVFSDNTRHQFWAVVAAGLSLPLVPGGSQIYPDIVAGLISLLGLYWFITATQRRSAIQELLLASAIVFLPWLQIKFAATCAVMLIAVAGRIYLDSRNIRRIFNLVAVAAVSCIGLALYNDFAFGKMSGPYQSGALELSKTSLMVLFGLHFDQNQGFLLQNPLNLVGLLAVGWLYRYSRSFAMLWALVFLSLIVPNALHPNWYGGTSFSGRFGWAATIVFIIPTLYGLLDLARHRINWFRVVVAGGVLLQLVFFYRYAVQGVNQYNKLPDTWFDSYSNFYYPIDAWLPMLYNDKWAFGYMPNYAWLLVCSALLIIGFIPFRNIWSKIPLLALACLAVIFAAGLHRERHRGDVTFPAQELPHLVGRMVGPDLSVSPGVDTAGFLSFGPYFPLRKGTYQIELTYSSAEPDVATPGWFDAFNETTKTQLAQVSLQSTGGERRQATIEFKVTQWSANKFEFRTFWNGGSNLKLHQIRLRKIN